MRVLTLQELDKSKVYYFASPYSHSDKMIQEWRYIQTIKYATDLINNDFTLIEPIAMSHHHAQRFGLPHGYDFWKNRDRKFVSISDGGVIVLMLPGWEQSVGVTDEIEYCRSLGKPVFFFDPECPHVVHTYELQEAV